MLAVVVVDSAAPLRQASQHVHACNCSGLLPQSHVDVPCLCMPDCLDGMASVSGFTMMGAQGGAAVPPVTPEATEARVCHHDGGLRVHWRLLDDNVVTTTPSAHPGCLDRVCNHCHDQVWEADAAEFYFSANLADTHQNVTEIDTSALPGGLWAGFIDNVNGYAPDSHVLMECSTAAQATHRRTTSGWEANLSIPWTSVHTAHGGRPTVGRINFYRMDRSHDGGIVNASAWAVTDCDGQMGCNMEHVPKYFGVVKLLPASATSVAQVQTS